MLNRLGVQRIAPYVLVGTVLWLCVLKSGVHATLAGVVTRNVHPGAGRRRPGARATARLEHSLHPWVAFGILPVFAFSNAGVDLAGLSLGDLLQPIPLGIMLGPLRRQAARRCSVSPGSPSRSDSRSCPRASTFSHVYGAAIICGIGFTMSLFIGMLAFENVASGEVIVTDELGILAGSLLSALVGYVVLHFVLPKGRCSNP